MFCTHVAGSLSSKDECLPEKETEMITEDITFVCYCLMQEQKLTAVCNQKVEKTCNVNLRSKDPGTRWKWVVKFRSF